MKGHVRKRCGCREDAGKQLGAACPQLKDRDHGTWGFVVDLEPGPDGRRRQKRVSGLSSEREAKRQMAALTVKIDEGTYTSDDGLTVAEWLDRWLPNRLSLRESTRASYAQHIKLYLKPGIGHVRLGKLRKHDIEELYATMRTLGSGSGDLHDRLIAARDPMRRIGVRPPSPATVGRVHATLRAALTTAYKDELIPRNVAMLIELEAAPRPPVKVWTPEIAGAFLDGTAEDRLGAMWHLIIARGLRRGEACGLSWTDVDLEANVLHLREQLTQVKGRNLAGPLKGRAQSRTVSLDEDTAAVLRAVRVRQNAERLLFGAGWTDNGRVFTHEDGTELHPDTISKRFPRDVARLGLPRIRLHDLRHTSASIGLAADESLHEIKERLGHSSISLTSDTYTHVLPVQAQASAERLSRIIPRRPVTTSVTTGPNDTAVMPKAAGETAGQAQWGGSDSNRRPRDYENDEDAAAGDGS